MAADDWMDAYLEPDDEDEPECAFCLAVADFLTPDDALSKMTCGHYTCGDCQGDGSIPDDCPACDEEQDDRR